ncbi:MAG: APC family permease [Actinomycetota bacterium]|nr:APC family permease [Actinomycetota bacterium]
MTTTTPDAAADIPAGNASGHREPTKLKRGITGKLLFLFVLGDVLGAGIYALIGQIAGETGGAIWVPLLVALLLALLTAGSYAELVTKYPRAGGSAVFAERAYRSPFVSFLVGYCMLAAGVVSAAGLAHAFSGEYLVTFIDVSPELGAVAFLILVALVNARGIKESMRANVVMTCIEFSGLLLILGVVIYFLGDGGGEPGRALEFADGKAPLSAIFAGALLAFYSFVGFETSANVAEEIEDPARVYPLALFSALIVAGLMYMLVGTAATIAAPVDQLAESTGPFLTVIEATGTSMPDWIFSLIALIAVANGALLTMIMSSRLTYGMAEQGLLPPVLTKVLPNRRTPWVAILATTVLAIALTFTGDLATLAETVVLLLLVVFLSTNLAVLVLRNDKVDHDHFRVWTAIPVLGILSCILLFTQQSGDVWLRGLALVGLGCLLYALSRLFGRSSSG